MNNKPENTAEISAELRELSRSAKYCELQPTVYGKPIDVYFAELADRIDAATAAHGDVRQKTASEEKYLYDCFKKNLTTLLRSHGVAVGGSAGRKTTMQNTNDAQAENNAPAEYDIKRNAEYYCRMIREYDEWLCDAHNRGIRNKECDYIMQFLHWLLVVKEAELTVKDLHGELKFDSDNVKR